MPGLFSFHLSVHALDIARGGRRVAAGLSFALGRGEALVLRGENGTGKTSALRTIAGFAAPMGGAVTFCEGADGPALDAAQFRAEQIHWLGGEDGLADRLTVRETGQFWAGLFGVPFSPSTLERVGLDAKAESLVGRLSTGQRRRLGLMRLVMVHRALWLLDEPLSGLDQAGRTLLMAAIDTHRAQGGMVVMASHDDGLPNAPTLRLIPMEAA